MNQRYYKLINSKFGKFFIVWQYKKSCPKIQKISILNNDISLLKYTSSGAVKSSCVLIDRAADGIFSFLSGERMTFDLNITDLDICGAFQKKILINAYQIPRGSVSTYKKIAAQSGSPSAQRAAGNALSDNPFPFIIPCHRIVRTDGNIGGYGFGAGMKFQLLKNEGVKFENKRKVIFDSICY